MATWSSILGARQRRGYQQTGSVGTWTDSMGEANAVQATSSRQATLATSPNGSLAYSFTPDLNITGTNQDLYAIAAAGASAIPNYTILGCIIRIPLTFVSDGTASILVTFGSRLTLYILPSTDNRLRGAAFANNSLAAQTAASIIDGKWHTVILHANDVLNTLTLYLDGVAQTQPVTGSDNVGIDFGTTAGFIGSYDAAGAFPFNGFIGEIGIGQDAASFASDIPAIHAMLKELIAPTMAGDTAVDRDIAIENRRMVHTMYRQQYPAPEVLPLPKTIPLLAGKTNVDRDRSVENRHVRQRLLTAERVASGTELIRPLRERKSPLAVVEVPSILMGRPVFTAAQQQAAPNVPDLIDVVPPTPFDPSASQEPTTFPDVIGRITLGAGQHLAAAIPDVADLAPGPTPFDPATSQNGVTFPDALERVTLHLAVVDHGAIAAPILERTATVVEAEYPDRVFRFVLGAHEQLNPNPGPPNPERTAILTAAEFPERVIRPTLGAHEQTNPLPGPLAPERQALLTAAEFPPSAPRAALRLEGGVAFPVQTSAPPPPPTYFGSVAVEFLRRVPVRYDLPSVAPIAPLPTPVPPLVRTVGPDTLRVPPRPWSASYAAPVAVLPYSPALLPLFSVRGELPSRPTPRSPGGSYAAVELTVGLGALDLVEAPSILPRRLTGAGAATTSVLKVDPPLAPWSFPDAIPGASSRAHLLLTAIPSDPLPPPPPTFFAGVESNEIQRWAPRPWHAGWSVLPLILPTPDVIHQGARVRWSSHPATTLVVRFDPSVRVTITQTPTVKIVVRQDMALFVGSVNRINFTFQDPDTLEFFDPSSVFIVVESPSQRAAGLGETTTYTYGADALVTKIAVGKYRAAIPCTEAGSWCFAPKSTGPTTAAVEAGTFDVSPVIG